MSPTMTSVRALIVHESMFGNTEAVADAIASGLRQSGVDVEVSDVSTAPPGTGLDVDLVVLGAPTHAFSLSRPTTRADAVRQGAPAERATTGLREWLAEAKPGRSGPAVAVFDTRVTKVRRLPAAAGPRAVKLARQRGFRLEGKPMAFLVHDVAGPLEPGELERAVQWGRQLAARYATRS